MLKINNKKVKKILNFVKYIINMIKFIWNEPNYFSNIMFNIIYNYPGINNIVFYLQKEK